MTASEAVRPQRRVGTFTLGVVLVAACWVPCCGPKWRSGGF